MNKRHSHPLRTALAYLLAGQAALFASMLVNGLLSAFAPPAPVPGEAFFRLAFGAWFILGCSLLYLIRQSRYHGWRILALTLLVYVGAAQVLQHIETVAFNFLFEFSAAELLFIIVSQFLTALVFVPLVITIAGKWKPPVDAVPDRTADFLPTTRGSLFLRIGILSLVWIASYWLAGFFIADPVTHQYYLAKNPDLAAINAWLFPLQAFRGLLWTGLFIAAIRLMNRSLAESGLLAGLLFGIFQGIALLVPSDFMPAEMRLSHLPEIVVSLVFQGGMTVAVLGWRKAKPAAAESAG